MTQDMTTGPVMRSMLRFAVPMILGNLLQQCYNIADTFIVGHFLGANALAAVGSSFTLMTFLTSILLGLCMGSGNVFSMRFGQRDEKALQESVCASFVLIAGLTLFLNILAFAVLDYLSVFLRVPEEVWGLMREYLSVIFLGIIATFFYNYFSSFLRALGNSLIPLLFLGISAAINIALDLFFVLVLSRGVAGAAQATVISQYIAGLGIALYALLRCPELRIFRIAPGRRPLKGKMCLESPAPSLRISRKCLRTIISFSLLTCIQQSVMNFGILMVQGLVNSFGPVIMAAFAAAVKIDAFAYMPVQDFGNAFSTFISQNYGAKKQDRIRRGLKGAVIASAAFSILVSAIVWIFARPLMELFVGTGESEIVMEGIRYLHIEGTFYCGIGCLFLLYGLYRALGKPGMSVVLTVISLGTRVLLAYILSALPLFGVTGIWWAIPIGWGLADITGAVYYIRRCALRPLPEGSKP